MSLYGGINLPGQPDLENIRKLDLMPMPSIHEMMQYGMAVDIDGLNEITKTLTQEMHELRIEICEHIPADKLDQFAETGFDEDDDDGWAPMNVESTHQIRKLLFEILGVAEGRKLKLTKSGDISTGKRQLDSIRNEHPVIPKTLAYRERAKLRNTYSAKLPKLAVFHPAGTCWCGLKHWAGTWRVHCEIQTTRTSTGRPATRDPNLQNIPIRSKHGQRIRACFIASPNTELVAIDFSQLELRILAHMANVLRMIQIFKDDTKDIHTETALAAFGFTDVSQVDKIIHRAPAKNVNFAIVYRETPEGLLDQLVSDTYGKSGVPVPDWLDLAWCDDFMNVKWHGIYNEVRPFMEKLDYRMYRYEHVWSLFGRTRRIPQVRSRHKGVVAEGLRQGGNMPIQGTGADMLKLAQTELHDWVKQEIRPRNIWTWPLNEVHDELILEVEEGYGDIVRAKGMQIMEEVMIDKDTGRDLFRVPIKADGSVGKRWEK